MAGNNPLAITFVPGEATLVAAFTMVTKGIELAMMLIADQTPDEKKALSEGRIKAIQIANELGEFVLGKLKA